VCWLVALCLLLQVLAHVPPMQRERVAQLLMGPGYLRKLLDLFRVRRPSGSNSATAAASRIAMVHAALATAGSNNPVLPHLEVVSDLWFHLLSGSCASRVVTATTSNISKHIYQAAEAAVVITAKWLCFLTSAATWPTILVQLCATTCS
jgi:hypothetical protein